ncbi:MAG: hypothetical protein WA183_13540 [Chthoniobacterales bacterium]
MMNWWENDPVVSGAESQPKTCVVEIEVLSQMLRLHLSGAVMLESWMEVMRLWLEKSDFHLMELWGSEFIALKQKRADILKLPVKTKLIEIESAFLDQLKSSQGTLDDAFTQFQSAFNEQNLALLVRWLEEYRVRKANLEQLVEKWFEDHPA